MSDYISKSAVLDFLKEEIKQDRPDDFKIRNIQRYIEDTPTLDEKEISRKPMERIVERMKKKIQASDTKFDNITEMNAYDDGVDDAIEIVKEEGGIE